MMSWLSAIGNSRLAIGRRQPMFSPSIEGGGQVVGGRLAGSISQTHPPAPSLKGRGGKAQPTTIHRQPTTINHPPTTDNRQPSTDNRQPTTPRAFTLIELMIAVAVLLVVILATAQIFGTASQVTGMGNAVATVMQEAAVIERMMREDFARISPEGFFAIRQVAVPNYVHRTLTNPNAPLLNPMLPEDSMIRADQLVFFTDGVAGMQTVGMGDTISRVQATTARVYYGHSFQLPAGLPANQVSENMVLTHDPRVDVMPWHRGTVNMLQTRVPAHFTTIGEDGSGTGVYQRTAAAAPFVMAINGTQPEATQWLLARQAVALASRSTQPPNANAHTSMLDDQKTARSIFRETTWDAPHVFFGWSNEVRNGRLDGAGSRPDVIKRWITTNPLANGVARPWHSTMAYDQRDVISQEALFYPRGERLAPSGHRADQALTNHIIGTAVSSVIFEWTYSDGVGEVRDKDGEFVTLDGEELRGFATNSFIASNLQPEHPWFGINRTGATGFCPLCADRGVGFYGDDAYRDRANYERPPSIPDADTIERFGSGEDYGQQFDNSNWVSEDIAIYEAIFGYNRHTPVVQDPDSFGDLTLADDYTPWPTAVRVTLVLHDPQGRLELGREVQFVIDLPKRVRQ